MGILAISLSATGPAVANGSSFTAKLTPNSAVLPADSKAIGVANFKLSADGQALHYTINVFNVDAVSQIHVHLGEGAVTPEGVRYYKVPDDGHGHTVAFLLNLDASGVTANATVAQGKLTASALSGPFRDQPLKVLIDHMNEISTYVSVHIFEDYGHGRHRCCPSAMRGMIQPDG